MMIAHYSLLIGTFAAAFNQSLGAGLNNSSHSNGMIASISPAVEEKSSLWHEFDGIPFFFPRPSKRNLNKKKVFIDEPGKDFDQMHRDLVFGDYADHAFTCPLTTTCPNVCVAKVSDCPIDATCASASNSPDHEFELCADGTCADTTLGEVCLADLETPCGCSKLSVACAKQIDLWDTCHDRFQEYYDAHSQCVVDETAALPPTTMTAAPVLFFLCMLVITMLMFFWCAYNQRLAPVPGSTSSLENNHEEKWTQTGYKNTIVGKIMYGLIILGHISIQVLLLLTVIHYCK